SETPTRGQPAGVATPPSPGALASGDTVAVGSSRIEGSGASTSASVGGSTGAGISLIVRTDERRTGKMPESPPIAETHSAVRRLNAVPIAPPRRAPSGSVPHTIQRIEAFIRPCRRGGQIAWRRLTCVMLYAIDPKPKSTVPTSSTGTGNDAGASGNAKPASEPRVMGITIAGPTPMALCKRVVVSAPTI